MDEKSEWGEEKKEKAEWTETLCHKELLCENNELLQKQTTKQQKNMQPPWTTLETSWTL